MIIVRVEMNPITHAVDAHINVAMRREHLPSGEGHTLDRHLIRGRTVRAASKSDSRRYCQEPSYSKSGENMFTHNLFSFTKGSESVDVRVRTLGTMNNVENP